jgi:hypothetical protein
MLTRVHGADTVHPRTGLTLAVPAVFRLAEMARSTLRGSMPRVLAGTLHRPSTCRCIGHVEARYGSCAVRTFRAAFRYPRHGSHGLVGFP